VVLSLALATGCADWQRPPLTAPYRAGGPVVQEQAFLGVSSDGSAGAVQLVDADGAPPRLELIALDARGGPTRHIAAAPAQIASAVARRLRADGRKAVPLLAAIAKEEWPAGVAAAAREGFSPIPPTAPDNLRRWSIAAAAANAPPLTLRLTLSSGDPPAFVLLLGADPGPPGRLGEAELLRQPIYGAPVEGDLWTAGDFVWLLAGSVDADEPLRRAIGLRRGSVRRGEAELHDARGLSLRSAGDLAGAAREFERAVAADPRFGDALYHAATTAAVAGREDDAVTWLRRAAEVDRRRVQVMGRSDESLQALRLRPDVRDILGMKQPGPETSK
jgi:tetratricopeptide (TPR) repeat protein